MSKYTYNKEYFNNIDTPDKAYWFGFVCADGCITRYHKNDHLWSMGLELTLQSDDKPHLEKYRRALRANVPIQDRTLRLKATGKEYGACRCTIACTNMCKALIRNGCTPSKSLTLQFPTDDVVPPELIWHFVRGYFDGDGLFKQYNGAHQKHTVFSLSGTQPFLSKLADLFQACGVSITDKAIKSGKSQIYELRLYGIANIKKALDLIYAHSTDETRLDRKYETYVHADFVDGRQLQVHTSMIGPD